MANTFWRLPIQNGDENTWAQYEEAQNKQAIGNYSSYLFDDSGTLKVTVGRIGIDDGTNKGVSVIDTETTISLAGISNGLWAKIEMSVSGAAVTFAATDIAGETDPSIIPTDFKDNWNNLKSGYYEIATKRIIGLIFKNSGGSLAGVINSFVDREGYEGVVEISAIAEMSICKIGSVLLKRSIKYEIGTIDFDTFDTAVITHSLTSGELSKVKDAHGVIYSDSGTPYAISADAGTNTGGACVQTYYASGSSAVRRETGGFFDAFGFSSTASNRGYIYLELEE